MTSTAPENLFCWSCQVGLTLDITVHVEDTPIPCCAKCWEEMPVAERLRVAQMFRDRSDGGVMDAIRTVFRSALGRFVEESGGDEWFRGRGN